MYQMKALDQLCPLAKGCEPTDLQNTMNKLVPKGRKYNSRATERWGLHDTYIIVHIQYNDGKQMW